MGDEKEKGKPEKRPDTTFQKGHTTLHDIEPQIRERKNAVIPPAPQPPKTKK